MKDSIKDIEDILTKMKESSHNADVNTYGGHMLSETNLTPDGRFRTLVGLLLSS